MADNLKAAAFAAGLSGKEKDQVDALSKALAVHKTLLALPQPVAQKAYSNLPADQQQSLATQFGTEQKPNRGWLGTAWHYTGGAAINALTAVSDFGTRLYEYVFEPLDGPTFSDIEAEIRESVDEYLPSITITNIEININWVYTKLNEKRNRTIK